MPTTKGPRKHVSEFQIQLGPINAIGSLVKLEKTDTANKYVSVCPDCEAPTPVRQQYVCTEESSHGPFVQGDLTVKARKVGDDLVRVSAEEVKAARTSELPLNVFQATVHARDEISANVVPGSKSYIFLPRSPDQYYGLLTLMLEAGDNEFIAVCNIKHVEGLYRLTLWNGSVLLQQLLWPEDVNEFEPVQADASQQLVEAAREMIERIRVPFDPDNYRSTVKEKIRRINEALGDAPPKERKPVKPDTTIDILSALESFGV